MHIKLKRYPFYIGLSTLVIVIIISLTGILLGISYKESRVAAIQSAGYLFSEINAKNMERYEHSLEVVTVLGRTAARMPSLAAPPVEGGMSYPGLPFMLEALEFYDFLFSLYVGYESEEFFQVTAVRDDPDLIALFSAPPETYFVIQDISVVAGEHVTVFHYLKLDRSVIGSEVKQASRQAYNPKARIWYSEAMAVSSSIFTEPYIFSKSRLAGITCAEKLMGGNGVFGADITLDRFALSLKRQKVSQHGVLFLFDQKGNLLAHPSEETIVSEGSEELRFIKSTESSDSVVREVAALLEKNPNGYLAATREINVDGIPYLVQTRRLKDTLAFSQMLAAAAPVSDFTSYIESMLKRIVQSSVIVLLLILPVTFLMSRKITMSLTRLESESKKIQESDFSESVMFDSSIAEVHSLIQSFSVMKTTIRRLLDEQRELFDALIQLLAGAIDAKSPYTGGHCARVPEVAKLLAEEVHETTEGPYGEFQFRNDAQWREFRVAAWLHDCGKVTTPEYVVDKATKLETIYDRIHEIRMRFEVLLRDAEISYLKSSLEGGNAVTVEQLEAQKKAICDDFSFVAFCNIGGEFMSDESIDRLKKIALRTWVRHLDDGLGVSEAELLRKKSAEPAELPCVEYILQDKVEHIIPRINMDPLSGNAYGFDMEVPENLYNIGELYNLCIRKGTLSAEERFKIQEHMTQTIIMLKKLPFPEYLKNVPEYAGAHHETLVGTGYPRKLTKTEMSVPARMMAIADIFEALTAADRPYKKPKQLSEALRIMGIMRNDKHIDADLFALFLERGVYLKYAEKYLPQNQIDTVNINDYL